MAGKQTKLTGKTVIREAANRYYGLYLPVEERMSQSFLYRQVVLLGHKPEGEPVGFVTSDADSILNLATPVGQVDAIYLDVRRDFELFLQKVGQRCEPKPIRPDVGAMMISGVINWEKIEKHKAGYLAEGHMDWKEEFKRFTAVPGNFKDRVLVLSGGPYSNLLPHKAGYAPEEWKRISIDIRMYHECTHFVCRSLWPGKQNAVFDEVVADAIGLLGALGRYDKRLAAAFLGFTPEGVYQGGRLSVYASEGELEQAISSAWKWLCEVDAYCTTLTAETEPFAALEGIMNTLI